MNRITALLTLLILSPALLAHGSSDSNKEFVVEFYNEVIFKAQPEKLDKYIGEKYIQHNPMVADGKEALRELVKNHLAPIVKDGGSIGEIIRVIAENDLVVLHVKFYHYPSEKGGAVMDIFRLEDGKIVEHWDVAQSIPDNPKNNNGMF